MHAEVGPDPVDGAARWGRASRSSRILLGQPADLVLREQAPHVVRRNLQGLRRLLGFMPEGGVENGLELLAHVVCDRAGRQVELDEDCLPALDAVNKPFLHRLVGSGTQQAAHHTPLNGRIGLPATGRGRSCRRVLSRGHHDIPRPGSLVTKWRVFMTLPTPCTSHSQAIGPYAGRAMPHFPGRPGLARGRGGLGAGRAEGAELAQDVEPEPRAGGQCRDRDQEPDKDQHDLPAGAAMAAEDAPLIQPVA